MPRRDLGVVGSAIAAVLSNMGLKPPTAAPAWREWRWTVELPDHIQATTWAVDSATGALNGIFDFDEAAVGHYLEDFKYMPSFGDGVHDAALDSYINAGGRQVSAADVGRFHLFAALAHFLFVREEASRWTEIVSWCRAAATRFLAVRE